MVEQGTLRTYRARRKAVTFGCWKDVGLATVRSEGRWCSEVRRGYGNQISTQQNYIKLVLGHLHRDQDLDAANAVNTIKAR